MMFHVLVSSLNVQQQPGLSQSERRDQNSAWFTSAVDRHPTTGVQEWSWDFHLGSPVRDANFHCLLAFWLRSGVRGKLLTIFPNHCTK